jgi:hypothetical protein
MDECELEAHPVTVGDLVAKLLALPQDARVMAIYDGFCTVDPEHVYLARGGHVVMVDSSRPVYRDADRPPDAPTEKAESDWYTPERQ